MRVVEMIAPVLALLILGFVCRKKQIISQEGMNGAKTLVTKLMLPVMIFHAMATAVLGRATAVVMASMFLVAGLTLVLGYVFRGVLGRRYAPYLPFYVCSYEGGMIAYPLYAAMFGAATLANVVAPDVGHAIFVFFVYIGLLAVAGSDEKPSFRTSALAALRSPFLWAMVLGLTLNLTGVMNWLLASPVGAAYLSTETLWTSAVTAIILVSLGYELRLERSMLGVALRAIAARLVINLGLLAALLLVLRRFLTLDTAAVGGLAVLMIAPTSFSASSIVRTEDGKHFFAVSNSLYTLVTVAAYFVLSLLIL